MAPVDLLAAPGFGTVTTHQKIPFLRRFRAEAHQ